MSLSQQLSKSAGSKLSESTVSDASPRIEDFTSAGFSKLLELTMMKKESSQTLGTLDSVSIHHEHGRADLHRHGMTTSRYLPISHAQ